MEDDGGVAQPQRLVRGVVLRPDQGQEVAPVTGLVAKGGVGFFVARVLQVEDLVAVADDGAVGVFGEGGLIAPDGLLADGVYLRIGGVEAEYGGRGRAAVFAWVGKRWIGGDQQLAAEQDYGRGLAGAAGGVAVDQGPAVVVAAVEQKTAVVERNLVGQGFERGDVDGVSASGDDGGAVAPQWAGAIVGGREGLYFFFDLDGDVERHRTGPGWTRDYDLEG